MIVKEMLLNALANAGHIHDGEPADADELELALRLFNSEMRILSNRNMISAYQRVIDIPSLQKAENVVGSYVPLRGVKVYEVDELPRSANKYVPGRDFFIVKGKDTYQVVSVAASANAFVPCSFENFCSYYPDILCSDMERVVSVIFRNGAGQWQNLRFVPLSSFFTEDDEKIYCTSACGENKVKIIVPDGIVGKDVKIVYNSEMNFSKGDILELPDAHITMVEIAVTVAILRKDADSDPTRLNNYKEQLQSIMDDIAANTATERRITRSYESRSVTDALYSGSFIRR